MSILNSPPVGENAERGLKSREPTPGLHSESLTPLLRRLATVTAIGSLLLPAAGCDRDASGQPQTPAVGTSPVQGHPKLSPFSSIHFLSQETGAPLIEVTLAGNTSRYRLLRVDEISVQDLWSVALERNPSDPSKRIAEDLPEILFYARQAQGLPEKDFSRMLLVLRDSETQAEVTRDEAATSENRRQIRNARQGENSGPRAVDLRRQALIDAGARSPLARDRAPESGSEVIEVALMREDLKFLAQHLSESSAFFARDGREERFRERAAQLEAELALLDTARGMRTIREWTLALHSLIRDLGDAHSEIIGIRSDKILVPGFAPFLFVDADGKVAAIREDRSQPFNSAYPFVESINGISIEKWRAQAEQYVVAGSDALIASRSLRMLRYLGELSTAWGIDTSQPFTVTLSNFAGEEVTTSFQLQRDKPEYGAWPRASAAQEGDVESRRLEGDISYLRVGSMRGSTLAQEIRDFMNSNQTRRSQGLIIDVRGNSGGNREALLTLYPYLHQPELGPRVVNIAAVRGARADDSRVEESLAARHLFLSQSGKFDERETASLRDFQATFVPEWMPPPEKFSPWYYTILSGAGAPYHYEKPVVVLINNDCFSATDVFVSAVGPLPNVTTMGTATSGGSGRSQTFQLPSGIEIRLSTMASFQADGSAFDGNGISPEIILEAPLQSWLVGEDPQLESARKWIITQP